MANINNNTISQPPVKIGDYVFASRWIDCDPNDPWAIGIVTSVIKDTNSRMYVTIGNLDGELIPKIGSKMFKNVILISRKLGKELCEIMPGLEGTSKPECGWKSFLGIPEIDWLSSDLLIKSPFSYTQ